ncbi:hypothetical protein Golob_005786 [Gossypium lobatum]|uniref:Uncharacterized protein n=1 Tax=Gossypium lobatum TaxID=34289 RepID=A0A7J8MUL8_9ROSI|nr:hypothetical protein [Gossypium lobatum]
MVQEGRPVEELYENNPPGVHDDKWKWLVERWGTPQAVAKKEGREPLRLEQFRFQHFRKDRSDKLSSEAIEQVYVRNKWDEACKRVNVITRFSVVAEQWFETTNFHCIDL